MRIIDEQWLKIFEDYKIVDEIDKKDFFEISSKEINKYKEARLMTKFDHSTQLPEIFKDNNIQILPNSRGTYVLSRFETFSKLKLMTVKPVFKKIPDFLETFDKIDLTSESILLNIAHATNMIDDVLQNDLNRYEKSILTLSGRTSSKNLSFKVRDINNNLKNFTVDKAQIEIDASYETNEKIAIIEAKNRLADDFLIRQLYYPFKFYKNLNIDKQLTNIYFTYVDEIFSFHVFEFENDNIYNSIKKIRQYDFTLNSSLKITLQEVINISKKSKNLSKNNLIFPQADSFLMMIELMTFLRKGRTALEISQAQGFDIRQSDYYANALIYLNLAEKTSNRKFILTAKGRYLESLKNTKERNLKLIELILESETFNKAFIYYINNHFSINKKHLRELILENNQVSESTANRRTSTVRNWIKWIFTMID